MPPIFAQWFWPSRQLQWQNAIVAGNQTVGIFRATWRSFNQKYPAWPWLA
jgi:hypothetical protein